MDSLEFLVVRKPYEMDQDVVLAFLRKRDDSDNLDAEVAEFIGLDGTGFRQLVFNSFSELILVVWAKDGHWKWAEMAAGIRSTSLMDDLKEVWSRQISEQQLNQLFEIISN